MGLLCQATSTRNYILKQRVRGPRAKRMRNKGASAAVIPSNHSSGARMTAFALYVIGFIVLLAGLIYGAWLVHIPQTWILVGALVLIGIGIMSAVSRTKRRDPPAEPPRP